MKNNIKIGDVYWVKFEGSGSEQSGYRPAVVIQNDIGNKFSPTIKVVPLTTKLCKKNLPTHVFVKKEYGLAKDSMALCEQETVCDKEKVGDYVTSFPDEIMAKIAVGLTINTPVIMFLNENMLLKLFSQLKNKG